MVLISDQEHAGHGSWNHSECGSDQFDGHLQKDEHGRRLGPHNSKKLKGLKLGGHYIDPAFDKRRKQQRKKIVASQRTTTKHRKRRSQSDVSDRLRSQSEISERPGISERPSAVDLNSRQVKEFLSKEEITEALKRAYIEKRDREKTIFTTKVRSTRSERKESRSTAGPLRNELPSHYGQTVPMGPVMREPIMRESANQRGEDQGKCGDCGALEGYTYSPPNPGSECGGCGVPAGGVPSPQLSEIPPNRRRSITPEVRRPVYTDTIRDEAIIPNLPPDATYHKKVEYVRRADAPPPQQYVIYQPAPPRQMSVQQPTMSVHQPTIRQPTYAPRQPSIVSAFREPSPSRDPSFEERKRLRQHNFIPLHLRDRVMNGGGYLQSPPPFRPAGDDTGLYRTSGAPPGQVLVRNCFDHFPERANVPPDPRHLAPPPQRYSSRPDSGHYRRGYGPEPGHSTQCSMMTDYEYIPIYDHNRPYR